MMRKPSLEFEDFECVIDNEKFEGVGGWYSVST